MAAVHKQDPAAHLPGKAHLVGDHHHSHALLGQLLHDLQHLAHHLRVQGGGGLVKAEDLRVHGPGPGAGHPLLLAAGELVDALAQVLPQAQQVDELIHLLPGGDAGLVPQAVGDVLLYD